MLIGTPCGALAAPVIDNASPSVDVDLENRTDTTFRLYRRTSPEMRRGTELPPLHGERVPAKPGTVWILQDEAGECLAGYVTGKQSGRIKIGDKELKVRRGIPPYRLKASVLPGFSVRPDRNEPYTDGPTVYATVCDALSLYLGRRPATACGGAMQPTQTGRHLEFDLGKPVPASSAQSLGVISDTTANVHVFLDHDPGSRNIRSIQELEPGDQAESERVEFDVRINGVDHVLLVGPWGPGEFNRAQTKPLHGEGTTKAIVKRVSGTVWEVEAPANSVGRLWNNADKASPIDRGLYRLSFRFKFELLPEGSE